MTAYLPLKEARFARRYLNPRTASAAFRVPLDLGPEARLALAELLPETAARSGAVSLLRLPAP